jgi:hypothetical protein
MCLPVLFTAGVVLLSCRLLRHNVIVSAERKKGDALSKRASLFRLGLPVLGAAYYFLLRPRLLTAGAQESDIVGTFPGDDLIQSPNFQAVRAVEIDAPPSIVWAWLAQMGRSGTGFYGIDTVTNRRVPSAAYVRTDLSAPEPGMALDNGYRILSIEPERLFLYGGFDLPAPLGELMERTTLFILEPVATDKTRLVLRTRGYAYGLLGSTYNLYYEMVDYLNSMAQLRNIKQRAEMLAKLQKPATS